MLFVQVHILHIHLSDFSTSVDRYMEQQMKLHDRLQRQQNQEVRFFQNNHRSQNSTVDENNDQQMNDDLDLAPILQILQQAGYNISDDEAIQKRALPSWSKITQAYGDPTILGQETCQEFRNKVIPSLRNIGVAGLFNSGKSHLVRHPCLGPTMLLHFFSSRSLFHCANVFRQLLLGTNLLNGLLKANCKHPDTDVRHSFKSGILWQVRAITTVNSLKNYETFLTLLLSPDVFRSRGESISQPINVPLIESKLRTFLPTT